MFIPFGTDRQTRKSPLVTPIIVGINTFVFALVLIVARETGEDVNRIVDLGAFDTRRPERLWTYVTCLFLHAPNDVFHVLFNMVFLWVFGCAVEDRMGRIGFAFFYLAGGLASVLAQWAGTAMAGDYSSMIGASGAVMAVTGSFAALFPRARIKTVFFFFFIGVIWIPALLMVGIYFALDILGQASNFLGMGTSKTAFWAHIGGSIFGFSTAFVLLATGRLKHDDFDIFYLLRQSRRRAAMRKAVAGGAGGPWESASADTSKRLGALKRRAPAPAEPEEVIQARRRIGVSIRNHDQQGAALLYSSVVREHPTFTLSVEHQLDVASTLFAEGRFEDAAVAYEQYLTRYRSDHRRIQTALLLTLLYVRKRPNPTRARELLDEFEPLAREDLHLQLVSELRKELDG